MIVYGLLLCSEQVTMRHGWNYNPHDGLSCLKTSHHWFKRRHTRIEFVVNLYLCAFAHLEYI